MRYYITLFIAILASSVVALPAHDFAVRNYRDPDDRKGLPFTIN